MVLVEQTLDQLLAGIRGSDVVLDEAISQANNPDYFSMAYADDDDDAVMCPNETYQKRVLDLISPEYRLPGFTFPLYSPECRFSVREIFINAAERGNRQNPNLPIMVRLFRGIEGHVLRVEDSGEGFDFKAKISEYRAGRRYYQRRGCGLRVLDEKPFLASYEGRGNVINLQVLKTQEVGALGTARFTPLF